MTYTLLKNGTIIDGRGGQPIEGGAILIKDNRIAAIDHHRDISIPNADINIIDVSGQTILPGLIDTHVHLMMEGTNITQAMTEPFSLPFYRSVDIMRRTLEAGVTTVRDAGGADLGLKRAVEQKIVAGPRVQISISVMSITGGHVDFWVPSGVTLDILPEHPGRPAAICDGVEEVRKTVRKILRAGADVIKICSTGGVMSPTDHPEFTQFSPEELAVIVQEAAYRGGRKVMSHAQGKEGIRQAVEAGVHSIEHAIFLDEPLCELMAERGTFVVPTLLAPIAVLEGAVASGAPQWGVDKAKEVTEIHGESIALAHKMGVNIAMGTDSAISRHGTNLRECGLMAKIGMSPMDVIVSTTKTAAECLGWDDQIGTLEVGKLADIVVTQTDPLTDIESLQNNDNIRIVIKDGDIVKQL